PIRQQFELIQQLVPEAKKVGLIYSSSEDNSIVQGKQATEIAEEMGFEVVTMSVSSTNEVAQLSAALASKVDAIWVPTDNTVASAINTLIKEADARRVPVFPAVDTMVEEGGLATIG